MKKMILYKYILYLFVFVSSSCLKQKEDTPPSGGTSEKRKFDWPKIADSAQAALNAFFWNEGGRYYTMQRNSTSFNNNYWPNAHALDVLVDAYIRKEKDPSIKQQMDKLLEGLRIADDGDYPTYYYDDMEWLLLSTLRAYQATNDTRYKEAFEILWSDVKGGWDEVSGGGFYWRKDRANKNTPANAPACIFAARLYQLTNNADDLNWAKKIYGWLKMHVIKSNGDVWDGLSSLNPVAYDTRLFTYNYGTVIGSAIELYKITGEQQYKNEAIKVAGAALAVLTRDGILVPGDNGDGGLFNGIFIRYLMQLIREGNLDATTKNNFVSFIQKNAETMWQKGTKFPESLIGPDWKSVSASSTLTPHLSGTMLAEAMAELKKLNLVP